MCGVAVSRQKEKRGRAVFINKHEHETPVIKANAGGLELNLRSELEEDRNDKAISIIGRYHQDRDGRRANTDGHTSPHVAIEAGAVTCVPACPSLALLGLWAFPSPHREPLRIPRGPQA